MSTGQRRLLSLNSYHYRRGGSDVVYLEHDALFRELGWETAVMSMHHPRNLESPWSRYFVDELEFGQASGFVDKVVKAGKVVWSREAQAKLRALLGVFRPDVAHLHCIYHHLSPSVLPVLREAGIPVVLTAHDLKLGCPAYKMLNRTGICERCRDGTVLNVVRYRCIRDSLAASMVVAVESAVQRRLDVYRRHIGRVIAPSRFYRDKLIEWHWSPDQIAYVPNYVDASRFQPGEARGDYFLFAGRLAPEKGVRTLVAAALAADVPLRVAGTGPLEAELRALPGAERVQWLGFQTGDALWEQVRGARALVLPSEWYENAPMSILEAYACGTPVIGADIGGIPELIEPQTGWVFRSGDVDDLAARLADAAGTAPSALREKGMAGRERVERDFNRARYLEQVLEVYRGLGVAC
jgi:glycosyltransferase involved in cell wall biosynthesis